MRVTQYKCVMAVKESRHNYNVRFSSSDKIADAIRQIYRVEQLPEEHVWLIGMDTQMKFKGIFEVTKGTANLSLISPREIFRDLLLIDAVCFVVVHNHPSGEADPSRADMAVTRRLVESGKLVGVKMLDHVIVTENGYTSIRQLGYGNIAWED